MKTHCEILIIGAGPAGATLARQLSKQNIGTVLIQRNLNFKKPCGGGIRMDAFDEFDLDKSYIKKNINTILLTFKGQRVSVDIRETPLAIVERREFDSYLREEAEKAGTNLYEGIFLHAEIQDDRVISTMKQGNIFHTITSKYLVAADGVNSRIRKLINKDKVPSLMTVYTDLHDFPSENCEFHFGEKIASKEYAWVFPESEGTNIGTMSPGNTSCMHHFEATLGVNELHRNHGYKIPKYDQALFYKNRVFFVGDSAGQVLPFTYEGIYYAMGSAKILAGVLAEASDPGAYEKRWNQKYLNKFQTLKKLQQIFLYNDFMIAVMMRLYRSKSVQKKIVHLWLKDEKITIDLMFLIKIFKKVLISN